MGANEHMNGRRTIGALALVSAFALCSCSPKITDANLREVKADMTTKDVESILGQPKKVEASPELKSMEMKTLPVTRYIYEQKGRRVTLTFVGDKLAENGIVGTFGTPAPSPAK